MLNHTSIRTTFTRTRRPQKYFIFFQSATMTTKWEFLSRVYVRYFCSTTKTPLWRPCARTTKTRRLTRSLPTRNIAKHQDCTVKGQGPNLSSLIGANSSLCVKAQWMRMRGQNTGVDAAAASTQFPARRHSPSLLQLQFIKQNIPKRAATSKTRPSFYLISPIPVPAA